MNRIKIFDIFVIAIGWLIFLCFSFFIIRMQYASCKHEFLNSMYRGKILLSYEPTIYFKHKWKDKYYPVQCPYCNKVFTIQRKACFTLNKPTWEII